MGKWMGKEIWVNDAERQLNVNQTSNSLCLLATHDIINVISV